MVGETVDFKIVLGEMSKLQPRWATGTILGRTDESDEVRSSWEQQSGSSLVGRFEGARETNCGSAMHSRRS